MAAQLAVTADNAATDTWPAGATHLEQALRWLTLLTAFSIPLSTSLSEIATGLFMACWFCSGAWARKWTGIRRNSVALWCLGMFGLLLVATTWSTASWEAAGRCWLKYREFLYVPMFLVVFQQSQLRRSAVSAFLWGGAVLLGMSYFEWCSGFDLGMDSAPRDFVIGKDHIIHSLIMAIVAYLTAGRIAETVAQVQAGAGRGRLWMYSGLLALAVYNELCMLTGRTGYLVLGALFCLFLAERMGRRGLVVGATVVVVASWGAVTFSPWIQSRVTQTLDQLKNQLGPERKHSPDPRMEFYANSLQMIARHPWRGTGTGSFEGEYRQQIAGTDDAPTVDPHNEYLHLACQAGIPAMLLFLGLLGHQWFVAGRLNATDRGIGRGVITAIALGCLFNSLIMSVTGGLIYSFFSALAFADLQSSAAEAGLPVTADRTEPTRRQLAA